MFFSLDRYSVKNVLPTIGSLIFPKSRLFLIFLYLEDKAGKENSMLKVEKKSNACYKKSF